MPAEAILAIDQGTTNSKAILLDKQGNIVALGSAALDISYPQAGWVEQSAEQIWSSVVVAIRRCIEQAPDVAIAAIGLSNQRESVVLWDSNDGEPIGPVITWQCRRTSTDTEMLKAEGHENRVIRKTGLPLDPLFPALKMRWLLENARGDNHCIGTVDSWLIWKMTAGQRYATDKSNASRTQLLNISTGQWDLELCQLFGIEPDRLAEVTNSKHLFGHSKNIPGIADGIPICSAMGDSHAALFGHAAFKPGEAKATFGTGSSVMMLSDEFKIPTHGMTCTIAWSINNDISYALEGNILVSASLFPWVAELLGLDGNIDRLMEMAASVPDSNNVMLVPALVGLGAPHWNPDARGIVSGLSFSAKPAHIAHAAALSLVLQSVDVFDAMYKQTSASKGQIYVDGGPTRNRFLMKYLADLCDQPVAISADPELSALGAGMMAGLEIGFWSGLEEISALRRERTILSPTMPEQNRLNIMSAWKEALAKCQHTS